jgi:general secretion pathway protein K
MRSMMTRQRGAVIIIVLWTSVLLTILVTVLASKVQLSAKTAFHNKVGSSDLAAVMSAHNSAEMELMLERMPLPVGDIAETDEDGEFRIPAYRFNGQPLQLSYDTDENIVVRIYDHAGKINLNRIPRQEMQLLIEKRLGDRPDPQQVQELLAAWTDWTDLNVLPGLQGAEDEYYLSLDPPYTARNNPELETVEELRLIRGFDELFKDVNLDAAFTVYGTGRTVNLNLATRETMQLLPGLNDELIEVILAYREVKDLRNKNEVGELIPLERMVELSSWIGNNTSSIYSVYAYPKIEFEESEMESEGFSENADLVTQAYMQIIEVRSANSRGRVYKVDPYGRLPNTAPARL